MKKFIPLLALAAGLALAGCNQNSGTTGTSGNGTGNTGNAASMTNSSSPAGTNAAPAQ